MITGLEKETKKSLKPVWSRPRAPPGFVRKKERSTIIHSEVAKRGMISNTQKHAANKKMRMVIVSAEVKSEGKRK